MVLAAEFGTGQVLWSFLWFFLFVMWIWLVITVFADLIRNRDMSGWAKAAWTLAILVLPYLGVLAYIVIEGVGMAERDLESAEAQEQAFRSYVQDAAGSGASPAEQLEKLAALHDAGKLDEGEYQQLKAKVLAG